jgi:hypothetical protein
VAVAEAICAFELGGHRLAEGHDEFVRPRGELAGIEPVRFDPVDALEGLLALDTEALRERHEHASYTQMLWMRVKRRAAYLPG